MTQTAGHQFFRKVLPVCNAPPASNCCAFSDVACREFRSHATHAAGLVGLIVNTPNFRPITTRFGDEAAVGNAAFLLGPCMQLHCMRY
jgi:hypothetical protein